MSSKRTLAVDQTTTRDRIVAAALQCFARSGFAGTSLAEIESAAGLSVGAGSTYRHFASKRAMLEAAVTDALDRADELSTTEPRSLAEAGRIAFDAMDEIQDLTRIVMRDLDRFPDLLMPVLDKLLEGPIRGVAAGMTAASPEIDGEAMATLLVGSLVSVKVIEALGGKRPSAIEDERLLAAWAHLYRLALENPT